MVGLGCGLAAGTEGPSAFELPQLSLAGDSNRLNLFLNTDCRRTASARGLTWRLLILLQGNVGVVTASVRFFISIRIVDDEDVAALDLVGDIIAPLFLRDAVGRLEPQRFDDVIPHPHIHFLDSHASPHRRVVP
jgi:hypothetical protein